MSSIEHQGWIEARLGKEEIIGRLAWAVFGHLKRDELRVGVGFFRMGLERSPTPHVESWAVMIAKVKKLRCRGGKRSPLGQLKHILLKFQDWIARYERSDTNKAHPSKVCLRHLP